MVDTEEGHETYSKRKMTYNLVKERNIWLRKEDVHMWKVMAKLHEKIQSSARQQTKERDLL